MNWTEIEEKYPKAYRKYDLRFKISAMSDYYGQHHPKIRALYDFFDENGIYITVRPYNLRVDRWFYDIFPYDIDIKIRESKSRTEAEEQAFIKAFEILNNKLK